ncbi:ribosome recycling factor [Verrucomicrobium sp. GAS474]|uniref:ribosome recycling factor n=1 Tax=Verrucomicrobium sp. GAS474 TaxID=1882831 RepID=UPI0008793577|nr:ribosome recycling factor [Verrucomicrobium sp. GAS474]SDT86411.1 ribosome recycling factor [Verrucomicrobium sp. GAS474]
MALDDVLLEGEEKMIKALEFLKTEFGGVRTGKASPDLVNNLTVVAYDSHMKLKEVAAVTTPDPRMVMIQPWDAGTVDAIRKAIEESKLGISPIIDGKIIRLPIPALSEERRNDLVKTIRKMAEEGRVALRAVRRIAIDEAKKLQKDGDITEDDLKDAEKEVQKLTDQYNGEIDKALESKEAELMKV